MSFLQKCISLVLLLLVISTPAIAKTQATASVSSNQVLLGDIFILTVQVNDTGSEYRLNTNTLVNDFTVYRPSRSQETSYVNGTYTESTTWSLRLQAKKVGDLTIPALKIGSLTTQAIDIKVSQPGKQQNSTVNDSIFIENSANKTKIYLDQPLILQTKIFVSENINDGDIQPPTLAGANIERIDAKKPTQVIRQGIRYQVLTYQYQITPSESGDVTITSPLLIGTVLKATRTNNWNNNSTLEPINIRGNDVNLTVKEIPVNFKGDWLVSEDVQLIENNNLQQQKYTVGEPITRSISLQIASLPIDKMPEIKLNYDTSLRYYPDQDDLKQGEIGGLLYSQRTITHAIIPSEKGQLILPEIKIPWWNSNTEKQEFAILPAQTLTIKAAAQENSQNSYLNEQLKNATNAQLENKAKQPAIYKDNAEELLVWQISTLVLLLLLILLSFYHFQQSRINTDSKLKSTNEKFDNQEYQQLLLALKEEKPNQVYPSLLRYFQSQQATVTQLQQVTTFTGLEQENKQQLELNLQQLELACSAKTHQWSAQELLKLIKSHHKTTNENNNVNSITIINP